MPLPFIYTILSNGAPEWMPELWTLVKYGSALSALVLIKTYCSGVSNTSEKKMHGKVIMITGGTSGIGAAAALELATRGAQIILLTRQPPSDPFIIEQVEDLRKRAGHQMIYAEQVDLSSLHSIRQFATKWIDNAPPRRLDGIVLCAGTLTPPGKERTETDEGIEQTWMVNFLSNFHLLGILSPAIKAQPFDRDVRVVMTTCGSYARSPPLREAIDRVHWSSSKAYARSKLALTVFGRAFQKHLDAYNRPDELPMMARVVFVDPGYCRTAGMTRWVTRGSLWGLLLYWVLYLFPWLVLKSSHMGAQPILFALMEGSLIREPGASLVKECRLVGFSRPDVDDEEVAKELWEASDALIEKTEKEQALLRARRKKEVERREKARKESEEKKEKERKEAEQKEEIGALVDAIKKGRAKEAVQKGPEDGKGKGKGKGKGNSKRKA